MWDSEGAEPSFDEIPLDDTHANLARDLPWRLSFHSGRTQLLVAFQQPALHLFVFYTTSNISKYLPCGKDSQPICIAIFERNREDESKAVSTNDRLQKTSGSTHIATHI